MTEYSRQRFRPGRTGVGAPLGDLESAIMRYIWECNEAGCLAVEVQQSLESERPVALTTVLTTLDRLFDKGIVDREREGKAYRYRHAITEANLDQRIVEGVLNGLIARFPDAVATYFSQAEVSSNLTDLARRMEELQRKKDGGMDA